MSLVEKQLAVIEERVAEARPRIVEQYDRVRHGAETHEIQINAVVLVNMLLTFNFMLDQLLTS